MPTVSLFASGMSQATNSIPASRSESRNAAFLASRSSFAITSVALQSRQRSSALASSGLSSFRPLSTSTNSAIGGQPLPSR